MIEPFLPEESTVSVNITNSSEIRDTNQILYLKADSNYTEFYFEDGQKKLFSLTLKRYEHTLQGIFIRVHHSYLVNQKFITTYLAKDSKILLADHTEIPVSRSKKSIIKAYFKSVKI